jgi:hypothetical protein
MRTDDCIVADAAHPVKRLILESELLYAVLRIPIFCQSISRTEMLFLIQICNSAYFVLNSALHYVSLFMRMQNRDATIERIRGGLRPNLKTRPHTSPALRPQILCDRRRSS